MMADPLKLRAVLEAMAAYDSGLPLMLMATADNSAAQALGDEFGVPLWFELSPIAPTPPAAICSRAASLVRCITTRHWWSSKPCAWPVAMRW